MKNNLPTYLYIFANVVFLLLTTIESESVEHFFYAIGIIGIMTIGVAHGAIDNLLFDAKSKPSDSIFMPWYQITMLVFVLLWMLFPNLAMFIFLTTSAYHFGQTQFVGYNFKSLWGSKMIFFIWGGLIFLLLFYFNGNEILALEEVHSQYIPVLEHVILYASYYLVLFASVYFLLSFVLFSTKQQTVSLFFKEFFTLLLVAASMYLFSAFVAFALFFVLMHSLKVMTQEFEYSKNKWSVETILDFLHLIKPISIVSIAIISFVLIIAYSFQLEHLITYMMIILLSSVTIPHSFVMEKFYDYFVIKNNNLSTSNNPL